MINEFRGRYLFLSNFYRSWVIVEGIAYPTVEHGFQAMKTVDPIERTEVIQCKTPGDAKRMGRQVTMRPEWEAIKIRVMHDLVLDKFQRHDDLRRRLLKTNNQTLVEGNDWGDRYWGADMDGHGRNELGKILMAVRKQVQ